MLKSKSTEQPKAINASKPLSSCCSFIIINKSNFKLLGNKWQWPSSIEALASIICRKPLAQVRFPIQLNQLLHNSTVHTSRCHFWGNCYLGNKKQQTSSMLKYKNKNFPPIIIKIGTYIILMKIFIW